MRKQKNCVPKSTRFRTHKVLWVSKKRGIDKAVNKTQLLQYAYLQYICQYEKRCLNRNEQAYPNYGGRGILICEEWLGENGFENFYKWSMENGYDDKLTIDRINVNGNYEPSNCRWVTYREQNRNKRNNIVILWNGETKILKDLCIELGMNYQTVKMRVHHGWEINRALTEPIHNTNNS